MNPPKRAFTHKTENLPKIRNTNFGYFIHDSKMYLQVTVLYVRY